MQADPDDLALALELADIADSITLERYGAADLKVATKLDLTPVSEADTAVEQAIRDRLASVRPADSVLGEEFGDSGGGTRRWIVDPIDGTMGYVRGLPVWATLVALQDGDELSVGVVSAPALRRRWWAARGGGAYLDDGLSEAPRQIQVSAVAELRDAQLCLGAVVEWEAIGRLEQVLELERRCWRTRGFGDFWSYMLVAEGGVEIGGDPEASLWDLAATQVIVEEAGGRFSDLDGAARPDGGNALASNGLLHQAALEILAA
ncbi:MAG: histidinol phosphatase [Solirubrobacterales bacterium]|nr:histidinol phosphatase [Solirubrobacterales bacterium]